MFMVRLDAFWMKDKNWVHKSDERPGREDWQSGTETKGGAYSTDVLDQGEERQR